MRIGEVAKRSGVSARMLRHYDRIGLVCPSERNASGYREYGEDDLRQLFHVESLRSLGLTLHEVGEALSDLSFSPAGLLEALEARITARLERDREALTRLRRLGASAPAAWSDAIEVIALLRDLDADDGSTRQRAGLASGTRPVDAATLTDAVLSESEPNVAGALVWALARDSDQAVPLLARALRSPHADRRTRAAKALDKIGTPRSRATLAEAVDSPDPFVRRRAAFARGRIGDGSVAELLIASIVDGHDDIEASEILGDLAQDPDCSTSIVGSISAALTVAAPDGRRRLTEALAEIPRPQTHDVLKHLAQDPDPAVAATARFLRATAE